MYLFFVYYQIDTKANNKLRNILFVLNFIYIDTVLKNPFNETVNEYMKEIIVKISNARMNFVSLQGQHKGEITSEIA